MNGEDSGAPPWSGGQECLTHAEFLSPCRSVTSPIYEHSPRFKWTSTCSWKSKDLKICLTNAKKYIHSFGLNHQCLVETLNAKNYSLTTSKQQAKRMEAMFYMFYVECPNVQHWLECQKSILTLCNGRRLHLTTQYLTSRDSQVRSQAAP